MSVAIIDVGLGNVRSVKRMIEHVGGSADLVDDPAALAGYERILLPGVGAFDHGMQLLDSGGWTRALNVARDRAVQPILGICLGMQLLCRGSEEGVRPGLGWIAADVCRLTADPERRVKVPHIGWSVTTPTGGHPLLTGSEEKRFYFVHSYRAICDDQDDVIGTAVHGEPFAAAVASGKVMGVQFHPEKSHRFGMALLSSFLAL